MKLYIQPRYDGPDKAHGGIRRVVEAQKKYLPAHGFEMVDSINHADIVATHASEMPDVPVGKPWVVHCHGLYWSDYDWPQWGPRVNAAVIEAMKRADHVTAPSEWVAYALKRGMWLNPTVLNHGIEPDEWEPADNYGYVLWNKARVDAISDPTPVNRLAAMAPRVQFHTTFGKPAPNIKILGPKPFLEAKEDIRYAGVYLATTRETFGIGTLEAMACGVPILGWDWAGQREIVKHGVTGWLAPLGDYDSLYEGLKWCFTNRDIVGKAARGDILENYTWKKAMERYARLYRDLLERQQKHNQSAKVSIIVPLHNLGHYLPDMVESVKEQTMPNWEMVIVDDKSTDDSLEIAESIAVNDNRIHVFRNNENLGLPETLNEGFKHTNGRYCLNLDPDNKLQPQTLKVLSDALDNDRSLHIAYGRIKFVLADGITAHSDLTQTEDGVSRWPPEFNCLAQFKHRNQIPSTCLYRREVLERTGGYRRRAKVAEDAEHWTRAVSYGFQPKKVTDLVTFIYRTHPKQKSNSETEPDWTAWMPWVKDAWLTPWGVAAKPPEQIGKCWPVPSCDPALLTVIIPVGPGHEKYVIDALDSVEGQIFRAWDCIVINDTGGDLIIPHTWAKIINTEGHLGPGYARNIGISASKTDVFVCLDADDIMEPDCLDIFYQTWLETGNVVYSQWWDDKGDYTTIFDPSEWIPEKLINRGCIHATCAIYPKKLWEDVGGFDPTMRNWEDWDFQIAYANKGYCATKVEKPLFTYRKTTGMRRETAASEMNRGEAEMKKKWPLMWDGRGKERLRVACSGCGHKKKTVKPQKSQTRVTEQKLPDGATLLEYIGSAPKSVWYGKVTRQKYIFGNNPAHKKKFVFNQDVPGFLAMVDRFREIKLVGKEDKSAPRPVLAGVMEG